MNVVKLKRVFNSFFSLALLTLISVAAMTLGAEDAQAQYSHKMISHNRSSMVNYLYISQGIEGEYGDYISSLENGETESELWQGYGFRNAIGLELLKFIQLSANHTFVNNSAKNNGSKRISGSRLSAAMKLVFSAPVVNLELGGGMIGSRLDYQHLLDHSTMYGSGVFYEVGLNYFVSQRVSFFGHVKQNRENLMRGSGSTAVKRIQTETMSIGTGFSVWL